jgi:hypothetical protein
MSLALDTLTFLTTPAGERLLADLAYEDLSDVNTLRLLTRLRRDHSGERAGAALELARLRRDAVPKFGADAARMFFTRDALEQASDPLIRRWRTGNPSLNPSPLRKLRREGLPEAPSLDLLDICCSIGSDSLAYAARGDKVLGIDLDPLRIEMACLNASALGLSARFEVANAVDFHAPGGARHSFYDPGRRTPDGRRIYDVEQYTPPLSLIRRFWAHDITVKLSPGVDLAQIQPYFDDGWEITFVSVNGDLKEADLTHNALLAGVDSLPPAAVLLIGDTVHTLDVTGQSSERPDSPAGVQWNKGYAPPPIAEPRAWLCEPDAAAVRAGLVQQVAHLCGGSLLDETIAYFTTDDKPDTPWARAWRIEAWMPFNVKRLREYLRVRGVGRVTVKKRGTAVTPDVLIPQLKLKGDAERIIVLTRLRGQQIALVCMHK